jgi:hypothetical protein
MRLSIVSALWRRFNKTGRIDAPPVLLARLSSHPPAVLFPDTFKLFARLSMAQIN